jgi:hypothetical protein
MLNKKLNSFLNLKTPNPKIKLLSIIKLISIKKYLIITITIIIIIIIIVTTIITKNIKRISKNIPILIIMVII